MAGAQALVAFKDSDGLMTVKTFNISSYTSIVPGKLSIDVKNTSAEFSDGLMKIFATVGLPEKGKTTVNQVWQVGPAVADGFPGKHEFQPANLNSKGTLDLLSGQSNGGAAGDSRTKKRNVNLLHLYLYISLKSVFLIVAKFLAAIILEETYIYLNLAVSCQMEEHIYLSE